MTFRLAFSWWRLQLGAYFTKPEEAAVDLEVPEFELVVDFETYQCQMAKVERFHLGAEDHGIFSALVAFVGSGWSQNLPLYGLDDPGTDYGFRFIAGLVNRIGSPELAKGRRVVVFRKRGYGEIVGFAPLSDDGKIGDPFFPAKLAPA